MTEEVKGVVDQPVRSPDIELDKKTKKHDADNADLEADLKPGMDVDLDEAELFLQQHDQRPRLPTGRVVTWGTIMLCTAAAKEFAGLAAACRFLLGVFEAVITPSFMLIARTSSNRTGVFSRQIKMSQIREVFADAQAWLLFFYVLLNECCVNGGIAIFSKPIVKGFTHDALLATAYGIPYGAVHVHGPLGREQAQELPHRHHDAVAAADAGRRVLVSGNCPGATTTAVCSPGTTYIPTMTLDAVALLSSAPLIEALQMPASNVAGYTKRTAATAFVFLAYCVGNIIGCTAGQFTIAVFLRLLLIRRNKRPATRATAPPGSSWPAGRMRRELMQDLTDFENPRFR
ncbi:hypothetical protein F5X96DRAFT_669221 [Biscogniauxia mediterranea]|nr:hypothetical protein F5X96DRAFT_669221 [Biscogniauxia mediterranea]